MDEQTGDAASSSNVPDQLQPSGSPMRVLIVDDNPDHAFLTAQSLRRSDAAFAPIMVSDGAACLDVLQHQQLAAIVMDYRLPDTDGLELLAKVGEIAPFLPVVLVTGEGNEEVAVTAMKLGAADYIVKEGEYFKSLPEIIEISIEHFRQQEAAIRLSTSPATTGSPLLWDDLPGVLSFEAFTAFANVLAAEAVRRKAPASLILLAAGAPEGGSRSDEESLDERLLRVVAATVLRTIRGSDIVGRHSIGSLAILMQSAGGPEAVRVAQRLLTALPKRIAMEQREITLRATQGIATLLRDGATLPELLANAETALTQALEAGADTIRLSEEAGPDSGASALAPDLTRIHDQTDLAFQRQTTLAQLTQAYERGEVEGIAIHTRPDACTTCLDAARDFYLPFMTPPLPLVGCSTPGGCRCSYRSPAADPRLRPPPIPAHNIPPFDVPRKWRDAALFGSESKGSCKPEDLAEYLERTPLLPIQTEFALHEREAAYLLRVARRAWERPTLDGAAVHGPSFPLEGSMFGWVKRVAKPPFLPGDALPQRDEGTLLLTNWRLIFYRRSAADSVLLADISDLEYLRDGIACTVGNRSNRVVFLLRDPLQVGLYVTKAIRDIATL